jgi:hypothetical protein
MRLTLPSLSLPFAPSPAAHLEPLLPPPPGFAMPPAHPAPQFTTPWSAIPTIAMIPPYDPIIHDTPSAYAGLFDEVAYGDIPSRIGDDTTRFVLNNPCGVTRDGSYDHMSEYLLELLAIGVDVIQFPESNVDWRWPKEFRKCQAAVKPCSATQN